MSPNQPRSSDHARRTPAGAGDKSPAATTASSPPPAAVQDADVATLHQISRMESEHIRAIDAEHRKESIQLQQDTLRRVLKEKPKQGHKMLFATAGAQQHRDLEAVLDPTTGRITTSPGRVGQITESIFRDQQQPPTGIKDGRYLPEERPNVNPQPWNGDLDPMQLCTDATLLVTRQWLSEHIRDQSIFHACCRTLSSAKAPGPDGITNDVIKILPTEVKTLIHQLFIVMWATGHTPTAWKHSDTCMIYKKGNPTNPLNYRPIGLANTAVQTLDQNGNLRHVRVC
jgi:hypothetical protein